MGDISIKGSNKSILRGQGGHGPIPYLNKPGQAQGTHGGKAKGGRIGLPSKRKEFKTHERDVPTMAAKGGRIGLQYGGPPNTGRTNLLEQLGRVEGERSNPNRRAEISRVHGELNRGYAKGGRAGYAMGSVAQSIKKVLKPKGVFKPKDFKGKGSDKIRSLLKGKKTHGKDVPTMAAKGGRAGYARGSVVKAAAKKIKKHIDTKKGKFPETESLVHQRRIGKKHGFQILGGGVEGKPHSTYEGRDDAGRRLFKRAIKRGLPKRPKAAGLPKRKA